MTNGYQRWVPTDGGFLFLPGSQRYPEKLDPAPPPIVVTSPWSGYHHVKLNLTSILQRKLDDITGFEMLSFKRAMVRFKV